MQRYCPICGENLPENSRLCPNCDKDKIEAQRLNREAREARQQKPAPPVRNAAPAPRNTPSERKKMNPLIIAAAAVLTVAVIAGGILVGIKLSKSDDSGDETTVEVDTLDKTRDKATEYFEKNIKVNAQETFVLNYIDNKVNISIDFDGKDKYLLDYAVSDVNGDESSDLVVAYLVPGDDDSKFSDSGYVPADVEYVCYCYKDGKFKLNKKLTVTKKFAEFIDTDFSGDTNYPDFGIGTLYNGKSSVDVVTCYGVGNEKIIKLRRGSDASFTDIISLFDAEDYNTKLKKYNLSKYKASDNDAPEFFSKNENYEYIGFTVKETEDDEGASAYEFSGFGWMKDEKTESKKTENTKAVPEDKAVMENEPVLSKKADSSPDQAND